MLRLWGQSMFYKGILKSYDATEQVGIIHLSDKDIDVHFSVKDFPNSTLEPQIGERVKCLVEEKDAQNIAKFIVRLDYKNARTEKPRNNIFYSEEEDLEVLKKEQQEKEATLNENDADEKKHPTTLALLENNQKLKNSVKLNIKKDDVDQKPLNMVNPLNAVNKEDTEEQSYQPHKQQIQSNNLTSSNTLLNHKESIREQNTQVTRDVHPEFASENLSDLMDKSENNEQAEPYIPSDSVVQINSSAFLSNEHSDLAEFIEDSNSVQQDSLDHFDISADQTQKVVNTPVLLLKSEDEIKIPQTAKLSTLTEPVDVDIKGTLDLSHPTEIKPIFHEKPTASLITPSNDSAHLSHAKTIVPLSSDPFEQLQQELGSRHTTSIPEYNRTMGADRQQSTASHSVESNSKDLTQQQDENKLQKVKTQLSYNTHKIKPNRKMELNFNPWILLGLISLILLAGFGYLGFEKYQLHKQEQEAKARYYLLEQQKAIEDQRKKMAKLSDKPIIPEHRRKELLGENAQ